MPGVRKKERETVEAFAKREANEEREKAEARAAYARNAQRLAAEMPGHFFAFAGNLREAVKRFNENCDPEKRITWRESAALASRDPNPNADFNLTFSRAQNEVNVGLNAMGRSGKPPVFVVEVNGLVKGETFMARIEGQIPDKDVVFRITVDFKKQDCTLKEFADRLVLGVVKQAWEEIVDDD
jgi:hypothetical protein